MINCKLNSTECGLLVCTLVLAAIVLGGCDPASLGAQKPSSASTINDAQRQAWGRTLVDGEVHDRMHLARQLVAMGEAAVPFLADVISHEDRYGEGPLPKAKALPSETVICWTLGQIGGARADAVLQAQHERFEDCRFAEEALKERANGSGIAVYFMGTAYSAPDVSAQRVRIPFGAHVQLAGQSVSGKGSDGSPVRFQPTQTMDRRKVYIIESDGFPAFF